MDNKHGNKKKSPKQPKSDTDNNSPKTDTQIGRPKRKITK